MYRLDFLQQHSVHSKFYVHHNNNYQKDRNKENKTIDNQQFKDHMSNMRWMGRLQNQVRNQAESQRTQFVEQLDQFVQEGFSRAVTDDQ